MQYKLKILCAVALTSGVILTCGKKGKRGPDDGESSKQSGKDHSKLKLSTKDADSSLTLASATQKIENCSDMKTQGSGFGPSDGICITPMNIKGYAQNLQLGTSSFIEGGSKCGPARLLALGATSDRGRKRVGLEFDLSAPVLSGGNTSLDCGEYESRKWDIFSISMPYVDVKLKIKNKYWTVRYIFEANPFTEEPELAKSSCTFNTYSDFITDYAYKPTTLKLKRGDVLLCTKDLETDTCADSDFNWLDKDTGEFQSTRPANAFQYAYPLTMQVGQQSDGTWGQVYCNFCGNAEDKGRYCGIETGSLGLTFSIPASNQFKLYSNFKAYSPKSNTPTGEADKDYLNGPYQVFTYVDPSGQTHRGIKPEIEIKLDLNKFLFIEGQSYSETLFDSIADADIFKKLEIREFWRQVIVTNYGHTPNTPVEFSIKMADKDTFPTAEANSNAE